MSTFSTRHCAVMLADLSGSSALYLSHGNLTATQQIKQQLAWLEQTVTRGNGRIVKTLGDGFLAVFAEAEQASRTAMQLQQNWPHTGHQASALELKIALTWGEVVDIDEDCYGDAINLASRILALTSAHENLASSDFLSQLPVRQQTQFRQLNHLYLRGRADPVTVWQMCDADFFDTSPADISSLDITHNKHSIHLRIAQQAYIFDQADTPIAIGRSPYADLQVDADHVSRLHAHIDWQQGQFVLIDRSLNGTCVRFDHIKSSQAQLLRRAACTLHGTGLISLHPDTQQLLPDTAFTIHFGIDF